MELNLGVKLGEQVSCGASKLKGAFAEQLGAEVCISKPIS